MADENKNYLEKEIEAITQAEREQEEIIEIIRLEDTCKTIAYCIINRMYQKRISFEELEKRTGITSRYVRQLEKGNGNPTLETLLRICDFLFDANKIDGLFRGLKKEEPRL